VKYFAVSLCVCLSALLLAATATAGDSVVEADAPAAAQDRSQAEAWAELYALTERAEPIETYQADFVQKKFTPLLRKPIESKGVVRIAPGVARWDTAPPYASTMFIAAGELWLHYPEQKTLEIYELGDRLDTLAASPVPDLEVLQENFTVASWGWTKGNKLLTVTMLPKTDELKDAIEEVAVDIDPALGTLRRLAITDLDGETTEMTFHHVKINLKLDPADLELDLPKGTKTVRPLEAVGG